MINAKKHIWDYIPHSSQIINPNIKQNYKIESVNFYLIKTKAKLLLRMAYYSLWIM